MLLLSAVEICLTWAFVAFVRIGNGCVVLALFARGHSLHDTSWTGLSVPVAVLEIWNLVPPVTSSITLVLLALGILGLALNRSLVLSRLLTAWQNSRALFLLGATLALLLAIRCCGPCEYYHPGLSGAPAVRWIQTFPIVPGLANLHGRLGYNSSVFLCIAALGQGPWKDLGFHLFTGFLLSALWVTLLPACARIVRGVAISPADWFHSILAVPALFWTTRSRIVGSQTDEPAAIVAFVAAGFLFADFCQTPRQDQQTRPPTRLVLTAALFTLAVAFKESTAVFAFLAWCLVVRRIWQTAVSPQNRRVHLAAASFFSAVLLLPWLARSIILSGYPFFPATIFAFPVPWKVPLSAARWYALGVQS